MLKKIIVPAISVAGVALSGCATQQPTTYPNFTAAPVAQASSTAAYTQKTNTLFVVVDASGSKSQTHDSSGISKFDVEKQFLNRLNKSIPANANLSSGLRNFGMGPCTDWKTSKLILDIAPHSQSKFQSGLDEMTCAGGGSPLENALAATSEDLDNASGNIALLIVADGHRLSSRTLSEAQLLEDKFGERLCIYSVWVGNDNERDGQILLQQFSNIAGCGLGETVSDLTSAPAVASFVEGMLYTKTTLTPAPVVMTSRDSDGDGVDNAIDDCPNTPAGAKVNTKGCWSYSKIEFGFDGTSIKSSYTGLFDNAVAVLKRNSNLTVQLRGHTDSQGPSEYNMNLSTRRAQSVKDHLIKSGIDASRLSIKGFGETDPIASNDTPKGRADNRRVGFRITAR